LYDIVRGIDTSPIFSIGQRQPVVSAGHEFGNGTNDVAVVEGALYQLIERVGAGLRERRLTARRTKITLDYSDGRRVARQSAIKPATANDFRIFAVAKLTLKRAWTRRVRVRHLRLICDNLTYPPAQMELFAEDKEGKKKSDNLITALDNIRFRFGATAIRVGRTLS
jgi:DNA polymerase-4